MNIQPTNVSFSAKWNIFNIVRRRKQPVIHHTQPSDTFTRTTPSFSIDFKSIKKDKYISSGREATVYGTNNDNYVLRITRNSRYNPDEMIPVEDGNGLILASNKDNTVQLLRRVTGEPLYDKEWEVISNNITKEEYLKCFNKIKELPDESFEEYIKNIINFRKNGYNIDTLNPNNILLDGTHLNIVDIEKKPLVKPDITITDFCSLVDFFHIRYNLLSMSGEERTKFLSELDKFFDRIIAIAGKEGYRLNKKAVQIPTHLR